MDCNPAKATGQMQGANRNRRLGGTLCMKSPFSFVSCSVGDGFHNMHAGLVGLVVCCFLCSDISSLVAVGRCDRKCWLIRCSSGVCYMYAY